MNDPLNDLWTSDAPALDIDALAKRGAQSLARQKRRIQLEIAATVAVLAFFAIPVFTPVRTPLALLIGGIAGMCLVVWWVLVLRNYRGTWSTSSTSVDGFLALERVRLQAAHRLTRITVASVALVGAAIVIATPFLVMATGDVYRNEPWRLGIAGAILVAVVVGTVITSGRQRRSIERAMKELDASPRIDG